MNRVVPILALIVGIIAGYQLGASNMPKPEIISHMPAVTQPDGSVILERVPAVNIKPPPHQLPKGAVEERRVQLQVATKDCKPISIDLSLVQVDGGRRVIASSPDGVVSGLDIPIESALVPVARPWAAGGSYDPIRRAYGAWVERDFGRLRVGAEARTDGIVARAGITF